MAGEDFNKRALLEIDLDLDSLNEQAVEGKKKVQDLSDQMKILKATGKENTAEYIQLQGEMKAYQLQVNQAVQVNKQLVIAQNASTGSIDEQRAQLSLVTRQYNSLSAEERANSEIGGRLLKTQKSLSDSLKELESAGGNNTRTIGQYREEVEKALQSLNPFQSQLTGVVNAFNSLKVSIAANAEAEAEAATATAVATAAEQAKAAAALEVVAANEALAVAEQEVIALTQSNTATSAELAAANQALLATTAELSLAQTALSETTATAAAAQEGAAVASEAAAGGFKLFDNVLKASIIGAIAGIILLLIGYLKTFDPLMDLIEQAFAGLNGAVNFVVSSLKNLFTSFTSVGDAIKSFGDFLSHPIDSMKKFGSAMADAAKDSATLKKAQQDLEDTVRINEVKSAETQQRVAELILKARNKSIDNVARKGLLDEAAALDKADFDRRNAQANEELRQATENLRIKGRLSDEQLAKVKENGLSEIFVLQGNSKLKGKITDDEVDLYKKAQLAIIAARDESTKRQEKIQNKIDADEEKAQAQREKNAEKQKALDEKLKKSNDDTEASRQRVALLSQSGRDAELLKINNDFDAKIRAAKGYTQQILQLEIERQAVLTKTRKDFAAQDEKEINTQNQLKYQRQIKDLTKSANDLKKQEGDFTNERQQQALDQLKQAYEVQQQADADNYLAQVSAKDLTQQQIATITEQYQQKQLDNQRAFADQTEQFETDLSAQRVDRARTEAEAVAAFEERKRNVYGEGLGVISGIFGKQTALGKAALIAQKGLAVAEIVIQTQKQVAAISLAAAYQSAAAALTIPFPFSIAAIATIQAVAAGKILLAEISGGIQVAAVVAQTISGFRTGGVFESDGRGAVLPGYSQHDNVNAKLRSGEGVVVSEAMRDPKSRAIVSAINVAHGGRAFGGTTPGNGFAVGGIFSGQYSINGAETQQIAGIIQQTAIAVAANIPQQILVIEDVQAGLEDKTYIANKSTI